MKIKDLLESIDSLKMRIYTAYRIYHCSPRIKNAIKQWKNEDYLPNVKVSIEKSENNWVIISSYDLVNLYGFKELPALLMLDDIEKAYNNHNKELLNDLLAFLIQGNHETKAQVSPEIMEKIRRTDPQVWVEYQKICDKIAQKEKKIEEDYIKIIETDL